MVKFGPAAAARRLLLEPGRRRRLLVPRQRSADRAHLLAAHGPQVLHTGRDLLLDLLLLLACVCVIILLLFVFLESIVIVNLAFEILLWDFFGKGLRWFIAHQVGARSTDVHSPHGTRLAHFPDLDSTRWLIALKFGFGLLGVAHVIVLVLLTWRYLYAVLVNY